MAQRDKSIGHATWNRPNIGRLGWLLN